MKPIIVLDNIRSAHNVGSLLRTANFFGFEEVVLCGVTPGPYDRFGRLNTKVTKVSLGAENTLSIQHNISTIDVLQRYKAVNFVIIGIEQDKHAVSHVSYNYSNVSQRSLFIFGEETQGLSEEIKNLCDELIEVPGFGSKESLNVSVTAGIILSSYSSAQALREQP